MSALKPFKQHDPYIQLVFSFWGRRRRWIITLPVT